MGRFNRCIDFEPVRAQRIGEGLDRHKTVTVRGHEAPESTLQILVRYAGPDRLSIHVMLVAE